MRKFINDIGCRAEFEDSISEEEIQKTLSWLGKNWREEK